MRKALLPALLAIALLPAEGGRAQDLGRIGLPLIVTVPTPPIPVRADG